MPSKHLPDDIDTLPKAKEYCSKDPACTAINQETVYRTAKFKNCSHDSKLERQDRVIILYRKGTLKMPEISGNRIYNISSI